jgi:hypothetical protein
VVKCQLVAAARNPATLRLDEQLTAVVLEGGDLDAILARVGSLAPGELTWVPAREPAASPIIATAVAEVGDGNDGLPVERDGLVAQPVLAARRLLGVLVATTTNEDRDTTHLVLERAAPILALTIAEARQAARASQLGRDIATIDLVSRREGDPRVDRERMRGAGLDPRRTYDVIVVDDPAGVPGLRQRLAPVQEATAAAYRDQAVLLVRHRTDWTTAWPADGPTAGLAGPVSGRLTFRDAYLDAARTARALAALGRTTGIARSDDLGVFGILLSHTGPRELAQQLRRELGPLLAAERRRGVPLVATLAAHLENGQRPSATAPALGVHVNTLYQWLAAIDRVLGPTWRERALELQVLLRVRAAADGLE